MRLNQLTFGLTIIGISSLTACKQKADEAIQRPNILVILADDMGYSDISCYGSEIPTPNIDSLAAKGVRLTQFYNAGRSCPSRASLLTGLYPHAAGMGDMVHNLGIPSYQGYLNNHCVTFAEVLKQSGYNTYMSGKWHVGNKPDQWPTKRGFDRYFGLIGGASSYFDLLAYRKSAKGNDQILALDDSIYTPADSGFYMTNLFTDYAIQFLDDANKKENPFIMYLAYTAPHWPLHALREDIELFRGKYMIGWDSIRVQRYRRMLKLGIIPPNTVLSPRDENVPAWSEISENEKYLWDTKMAIYAAMIYRMDLNIGRVIAKLREMKELENTLIVFLSDNGACHEVLRGGDIIERRGEPGTQMSFGSYEYPWANVSNTPFRMYKHWMHEGGIITPFIACYPSLIKANTINNELAHITDLMPTFIELAQSKYPKKYKDNTINPLDEALSLISLFKAGKYKLDDPRGFEWEHEGNKAIRKGDWKMVSKWDIEKNKPGEWELYNISKDRCELKDRSKENRNLVKFLDDWYLKWAVRNGVLDWNEVKEVNNQ